MAPRVDVRASGCQRNRPLEEFRLRQPSVHADRTPVAGKHTHTPVHRNPENERIHQAATIMAFTERLMPSAPGKPGARDAGVLNYIDLALSGAYAGLQDFYRRGLAQLDAYCRKTYHEPFVRLGAARQDEVITALDEGKATGFTAATRTSQAGAWWASPARKRLSRRPGSVLEIDCRL